MSLIAWEGVKMERLIVDGYGKYVGKRANQIVIKEGGKVKHYVVAEKLRQVLITGHGSIGFDAMNLLAENGVDLIVINWKGDVTARLSSPAMRTVATRKEQYYAYKDERSGHLAKNFAFAKAKNQYAFLGTLAKSRKDSAPEIAEMVMKRRDEILNQFQGFERLKDAPVDRIRETLNGLEGHCAYLYWDAIERVIPGEFGFRGRSGRYAKDGVNAMLNYGYGVLEGEVWRAVHFAGLDPYGGFLHVDRPGRPSMVLDLMEEFRQQVVDKCVIALISRRVVKESDFSIDEGLCRLSDSARKALLTEILQKLEDYVRAGSERIRWCDLILKQSRNVAKYLRKEVSAYEGFYLRW